MIEIDDSELIKRFKEGLDLGRIYYEGFADFFYDELGRIIVEKHLAKLYEGKYIENLDNHLILTKKGLKYFYSAKSREFKYRSKSLYQGRDIRKGQLLCIIILVLITLLAIFANDINNLINGF